MQLHCLSPNCALLSGTTPSKGRKGCLVSSMTFEIRTKVPTGTPTPGVCHVLCSIVCLEWLLKPQLIHKASIKNSASSAAQCCCFLSFLGSVLVFLISSCSYILLPKTVSVREYNLFQLPVSWPCSDYLPFSSSCRDVLLLLFRLFLN